jgi:hypothetical protein
MPKHPARLEVEEPPWALMATLGMLGVDLVQVYGTRASNARQIEFAVRDHVVAVVPTAVEATALCSKGLQGSGCTILRSGTEMSGHRNPPSELIDRIFGDRAMRIPTSSGDQLAVLADFYRGPVGYSPQGRFMVAIALGDAPGARTMQIETSLHVRDVPEAFLAGAELLETITIDPAKRPQDLGGSALAGP